uniref:FBA_2 domain-containing protein n=2 Tax=Caenorhabditis tropicalis TaxID=1561998 RepID=A0A1I7TH99_9PELO
MMTPFESINLSLTSSRAKIAFFSENKPGFQVTLDLTAEPSITIKGNEMKWTYSWLPRHFYQTKETKITCDYLIYEISENPMQDFMIWYNRVNGILGSINKANISILNTTITNWLRSQQESIEEVSIFESCHQDVQYFSKNIKVLLSLNIFMNYNDKQFRMEIPDELTHLTIRNASFIKFEQFMSMKHQEIIIYGCDLTNLDIYVFLKSWMACESHLGLKTLKITFYGFSTMDMDLPYQWTTDPNIIKQFTSNPFNINITKGFNIKRCDGKMATLGAERINGKWHICFLVH